MKDCPENFTAAKLRIFTPTVVQQEHKKFDQWDITQYTSTSSVEKPGFFKMRQENLWFIKDRPSQVVGT